MQHSCSHYNAICNHSCKKRIELRTQEQPLVAKHIGGTIRAWNDPSRTRRTHEVPFIVACSHFTWKTQGFVLRLPPQNIAHATFMQPFQCDLQPQCSSGNPTAGREERFLPACTARWEARHGPIILLYYIPITGCRNHYCWLYQPLWLRVPLFIIHDTPIISGYIPLLLVIHYHKPLVWGCPYLSIHDIPIINGYIPLLLVIRRCCHFRTGLLRQLRTRRQLRT